MNSKQDLSATANQPTSHDVARFQQRLPGVLAGGAIGLLFASMLWLMSQGVAMEVIARALFGLVR